MAFPLAAMKTALYSRLSGDSTLAALATGGIVDKWSLPTSNPYLSYQISWTPQNNLGGLVAHEGQITLRGIQQGWSSTVAESMISRVEALLENLPLTISGWRMGKLRAVNGTDFTEENEGAPPYQVVVLIMEFWITPSS